MSGLAAPAFPPYPPRLTLRHFATRQIIFNQLIGTVGVLMLPTSGLITPQPTESSDWLYFVAWIQLIVVFGLLINASAGLLTLRQGWRQLPDAQARYDRLGLFHALPAATTGRLLLVMIVCPVLSSWLAQQCFILLQSSAWGLANLGPVQPTYGSTLRNMLNGVVASAVFEYLHDRWTHREARARVALQLTTDAQLQLLRAQLDPHMLFNTLSNLYELIEDSPQQARAMLLHLIGFLRSTLDGSRTPQHALHDEFKLASDYLSLMQIRMGDRLRTTLDLPEALRAIPVPAMLLQPVIENAIKHGLEQRRHGGELTVAATQEAGQLVLRVRNSGAHQPGGSDPLRPGGFGLRSVKDRLAMLCGPGDHVELIHLHEQDATEVTLRLPLVEPRGAP